MAPYLTLLPLEASQRRHDLRAVFDALRWLLRAGAPWRLLPGDFPPWHAVYDQAQRWIAAGAFEAIAWMAHFRRLARDYERLPATLAGLHLVAFATLMLSKATALFDLVRNTL